LLTARSGVAVPTEPNPRQGDTHALEPILKVVESSESVVIRYVVPMT
jgi:hypothetical protein